MSDFIKKNDPGILEEVEGAKVWRIMKSVDPHHLGRVGTNRDALLTLAANNQCKCGAYPARNQWTCADCRKAQMDKRWEGATDYEGGMVFSEVLDQLFDSEEGFDSMEKGIEAVLDQIEEDGDRTGNLGRDYQFYHTVPNRVPLIDPDWWSEITEDQSLMDVASPEFIAALEAFNTVAAAEKPWAYYPDYDRPINYWEEA